MGIVLNWNSTYPGGGIDDTTINFPILTDIVHDVLASHVNSLASAIIALETAVGINGGLTVREADLTPSVVPVHTIVFSNGSVTDLGSGVVQVVVGGGGSVSPFPFVPTSAELGTPVIIGTVTGGVAISDVAGSTTGSPFDYIQITATDPQAGATVIVPITMPVTPFPDKFQLILQIFTGTPPTADFLAALSFTDNTGNLAWTIMHEVTVATTTRPAFTIVETDTLVTGATWDMPDLSIGNALDAHISIKKVAPFTAVPQVLIESVAGNFSSSDAYVSSAAWTISTSSGTVNAGWVGEDFKEASLVLQYANTIAGAQDVFVSMQFLPHVEDR